MARTETGKTDRFFVEGVRVSRAVYNDLNDNATQGACYYTAQLPKGHRFSHMITIPKVLVRMYASDTLNDMFRVSFAS